MQRSKRKSAPRRQSSRAAASVTTSFREVSAMIEMQEAMERSRKQGRAAAQDDDATIGYAAPSSMFMAAAVATSMVGGSASDDHFLAGPPGQSQKLEDAAPEVSGATGAAAAAAAAGSATSSAEFRLDFASAVAGFRYVVLYTPDAVSLPDFFEPSIRHLIETASNGATVERLLQFEQLWKGCDLAICFECYEPCTKTRVDAMGFFVCSGCHSKLQQHQLEQQQQRLLEAPSEGEVTGLAHVAFASIKANAAFQLDLPAAIEGFKYIMRVKPQTTNPSSSFEIQFAHLVTDAAYPVTIHRLTEFYKLWAQCHMTICAQCFAPCTKKFVNSDGFFVCPGCKEKPQQQQQDGESAEEPVAEVEPQFAQAAAAATAEQQQQQQQAVPMDEAEDEAPGSPDFSVSSVDELPLSQQSASSSVSAVPGDGSFRCANCNRLISPSVAALFNAKRLKAKVCFSCPIPKK